MRLAIAAFTMISVMWSCHTNPPPPVQHSATLIWTEATPNCTFTVMRRVHGQSTFVKISTTSGLKYVDSSVTAAVVYDYEIIAQDSGGTTASNVQTVTIP